MAEKGTRNGFSIRSRVGRLGSVGAAGTAVAVALLAALAPASIGSAPPITFHPGYKGVSGHNFYVDGQGCGHAKGVTAFSFGTGNLTAYSTSTAKTCRSILGNVNAGSYYYGSWGSNNAIKIRVPVAGTDNLSAAWSLTWTSTGSSAHTGTTCPTTPFASYYHYSSSSYMYWQNYSGYRGYCYSYLYAAGSIYSTLQDLKSGQTWYVNYPSPQALNFYSYVSNSTSVGFTWYHDTTWTSSGGYSYSNGSYTGNYSYQYSDIGGKYCNGNTCPTSWSNTSAGTATVWINGTGFNRLDPFLFYFSVYVSSSAEVGGWAHASATANFNMATGGNGARLTAITIT